MDSEILFHHFLDINLPLHFDKNLTIKIKIMAEEMYPKCN